MNVNEPVDGSNLTTREATVRGNSTAPAHFVILEGEELGDHPGTNMAWDSGALVMRPQMLFNDDFSGADVNMTRWSFVRETGVTHILDGSLLMRSDRFASDKTTVGLIESTRDLFPDEMDWTAEFKLAFDSVIDWRAGLSGGMTPDQIGYGGSTAVVNCALSNRSGPEVIKVFAKGSEVYDELNSGAYHVVRLEYTSTTGGCKIFLDDDLLSTFKVSEVPSFFWFGSIDNISSGIMFTQMSVDYVNLWTYSGKWLSLPYDFGHDVEVDALKPRWTTTHQSSTNVSVEARTSDDNSSWSGWTHAVDIGRTSTLRGRYLQLRVNASLPGIKSEQGKISFRSFDVIYRDPIASVEARRSGGAWVSATGNESWSVDLDLEEDLNVVEVRATDTSGAINETSLNVTVDTTPPVGTVSIITDRPIINDPNVTLSLNATDRYGVATVQVSNVPDMSRMSTFPYSTELPWNIEGVDGEVSVYVRFVDFHGLLSDIARDSVTVDGWTPSGSLLINDGAIYTASTTVHLDMDYYDNMGVATVEISNRPDLSDSMTITPPQVGVDPWELEGGDDGLRTVYIRITDVAGNVAFINATIDLYIPKALGNVTIEGGADFTSKSIVQLQILIPRELKTTRGQLSNVADFEGATWETLTKDKLWMLSPGDGHRTVYLRFEDFRGIVSLPVSASIIVDSTKPMIQVLLENGAQFTTVSELTATVVYDDANPPARMWMADNDRLDLVEAELFFSTFRWSIPAHEGVHSLYVMVEDLAGNTAKAFTSIHYATKVPEITLVLPGGSNSNAEGSVDVTVEWADEYGDIEIKLAFDSDPTMVEEWNDPAGTQSVAIPPGTPDGLYQIKGIARNNPGLESDVMIIDIILDRTPPQLDLVKPTDGSKVTQEGRTVKVVLGTDDIAGDYQMSYRIDGGAWVQFVEPSEPFKVKFPSYDKHTLEVRAVDEAGNEVIATSDFKLEKEESGVPGIAALLALSALVCAGLIFRRRA